MSCRLHLGTSQWTDAICLQEVSVRWGEFVKKHVESFGWQFRRNTDGMVLCTAPNVVVRECVSAAVFPDRDSMQRANRNWREFLMATLSGRYGGRTM